VLRLPELFIVYGVGCRSKRERGSLRSGPLLSSLVYEPVLGSIARKMGTQGDSLGYTRTREHEDEQDENENERESGNERGCLVIHTQGRPEAGP
jgi:hypothetical protein